MLPRPANRSCESGTESSCVMARFRNNANAANRSGHWNMDPSARECQRFAPPVGERRYRKNSLSGETTMMSPSLPSEFL